MDRGTEAVLHCSAKRTELNMPLKQDNTDVIQHCYQEGSLENTLPFLAGLTDFPVRADFSAAWQILGGISLLHPQASILVFTLYDLCQQTKQPGLFPEVPLFSVKDRWHL